MLFNNRVIMHKTKKYLLNTTYVFLLQYTVFVIFYVACIHNRKQFLELLS